MEGNVKLLRTEKFEDGSLGYDYFITGKYCSESDDVITCKNNNCKKAINKGDTYYTYYINSSDKKIESANAINEGDTYYTYPTNSSGEKIETAKKRGHMNKFCSQECAEEVCLFDLLFMDFNVRLDEIESKYNIETLKKMYDLMPKGIFEPVSCSSLSHKYKMENTPNKKTYLSLTKTAKNSEWIDKARNSEEPIWLPYYRAPGCPLKKISQIINDKNFIDVLVRPSEEKDEDGNTSGLYLWSLKVTSFSKEEPEDDIKKVRLKNEDGPIGFWMKVEKIVDIKENPENYSFASGEKITLAFPSLIIGKE